MFRSGRWDVLEKRSLGGRASSVRRFSAAAAAGGRAPWRGCWCSGDAARPAVVRVLLQANQSSGHRPWGSLRIHAVILVELCQNSSWRAQEGR